MAISLFRWSRLGSEHAHVIRLKLHDINQLFNSMDPAPFIEKDLDSDAEEFIVDSVQDFPPGAPVRLRIDLEQWPAEDPKEMIRQAIHHYFSYCAERTRREFRRLIRQGRTTLLIGVAFLAFCLVVIRTLLPAGETGTWASMLRESLTIAGWVAMWRPMQIFLYEWWPLRRREAVYNKLSHMPVEVVQHGRAQPVQPAIRALEPRSP